MIFSCLCAMFELRFSKFSAISPAENVTEERRLLVTWFRFAGSLLLLLDKETFFKKKMKVASRNWMLLLVHPENYDFQTSNLL